jgi:hypothetical protein
VTVIGLLGAASPAAAQSYGEEGPRPGSSASSNSVFVGDTVAFRFSGCVPGGDADIDINGERLRTQQADSEGDVRFSLTFNEPGRFVVRVACDDPDGDRLVQSETIEVRERSGGGGQETSPRGDSVLVDGSAGTTGTGGGLPRTGTDIVTYGLILGGALVAGGALLMAMVASRRERGIAGA